MQEKIDIIKTRMIKYFGLQRSLRAGCARLRGEHLRSRRREVGSPPDSVGAGGAEIRGILGAPVAIFAVQPTFEVSTWIRFAVRAPGGEGGVAAGARGLAFTVVCKATFELRPDLRRSPPRKSRSPSRMCMSTRGCASGFASDSVPAKKRPEALLTGHAYAPEGRPACSAAMARLSVGEIDKTIHVVGDRHFSREGGSGHPGVFLRMPLGWSARPSGRTRSIPRVGARERSAAGFARARRGAEPVAARRPDRSLRLGSRGGVRPDRAPLGRRVRRASASTGRGGPRAPVRATFAGRYRSPSSTSTRHRATSNALCRLGRRRFTSRTCTRTSVDSRRGSRPSRPWRRRRHAGRRVPTLAPPTAPTPSAHPRGPVPRHC